MWHSTVRTRCNLGIGGFGNVLVRNIRSGDRCVGLADFFSTGLWVLARPVWIGFYFRFRIWHSVAPICGLLLLPVLPAKYEEVRL